MWQSKVHADIEDDQVSTLLFFFSSVVLRSDRRRILLETNPLAHHVCERNFLLRQNYFFPLGFIFPIIEKGERIGLYRHFQIHQVHLVSTWTDSLTFLCAFYSFLFFSSYSSSNSTWFFFFVIRKCVASCNRKQNVHNTPRQGPPMLPRKNYLRKKKGLDYLTVRVIRSIGVVILITASCSFFFPTLNRHRLFLKPSFPALEEFLILMGPETVVYMTSLRSF